MDLLRRAVALVHQAGYRVENVDTTLICELPKIGPHAAAIRTSLAAALGVEFGSVSVKGKTNEGMGWEGEGKGIAVHAVALLRTES
jgi:2-C-methyl-D-erythritol 2,4-cyclodiphosphate synthase